ncbi:ADP-ribosylation/crystallin J1 [uncultured Streptococcus sp.]|nr:ADP-ribosylation/crystallin J1 [uncultured Streptococcus sp.]
MYTIAAICGGLAEAYYGFSDEIRQEVLSFLDNRLLEIVVEFENTYPK